MYRIKQSIVILLLSLSLSGCQITEQEKYMLDQARQALMNGEFGRSFESMQQVYHGRKGQVGLAMMPNDSLTRQFLMQSSDAMQLASCIVLDMLNLVEQTFGKPGHDFKQQMQSILREIEKFKPNPAHFGLGTNAARPEGLSDEQLQMYLQAQEMAKQRARELKQVRTCLSVNKEYNLLKKEMGQMMHNYGFTSGQQHQLQSYTRQSFYHNYLQEYTTVFINRQKATERPAGYEYYKLD